MSFSRVLLMIRLSHPHPSVDLPGPGVLPDHALFRRIFADQGDALSRQTDEKERGRILLSQVDGRGVAF